MSLFYILMWSKKIYIPKTYIFFIFSNIYYFQDDIDCASLKY